jgi:serine/threonine-protein kinase RsbW
MTNLVTKKWQIGPIDIPEGAGMTEHKGRPCPSPLIDAKDDVQRECHELMKQHVDPSPRGAFFHNWVTEELIMNALGHGNNLDPAKVVQIHLVIDEVREDGFRKVLAQLHVLDEGASFNPDEVPDPTATENIEKPNGRGVLGTLGLIQRWYDGGGISIDHEKPEGAETGKRVIVSWKRKEAIPSDAQ